MGCKLMIFAGVTTLLQAMVQVILTSMSLAEYFCLINFLRELPTLLFIKILYLYNPDQCGTRINIGQTIDGMTDQAFVLVTSEALTVKRTFYINCVSLGLGVLWLITSAILMTGGAKNNNSKPIRWPWILISVTVCAVDVVASVIFANDSFYTRSLTDITNYIGASTSGTGNLHVDTSFVAWIMVILYSRFVIFYIINVVLIVLVALDKNGRGKTDVIFVENAARASQDPLTTVTRVATQDVEVFDEKRTPVNTRSQPPTPKDTIRPHSVDDSDQVVKESMQQSQRTKLVASLALSNITEASSGSRPTDNNSTQDDHNPRIPRAGFNQAFRRWKKLLFATEAPTPRSFSVTDSIDISPEKLENMLAEQQRRLDKAMVDTAGRVSPPRATQSLPQLNETTQTALPIFCKERRDTAAELQGQLPWAYIPASAHRMRDQLPSDEDLPPVPLPDYTAIPSFRKASVHRAASSLSSTQKRNYFVSKQTKSPLTQFDVLY